MKFDSLLWACIKSKVVVLEFAYTPVPTRSSADADNRLDAVFTIFVFKKIHDLEMGVKGHSRSLRVVSFDRLCMVSY